MTAGRLEVAMQMDDGNTECSFVITALDGGVLSAQQIVDAIAEYLLLLDPMVFGTDESRKALLH